MTRPHSQAAPPAFTGPAFQLHLFLLHSLPQLQAEGVAFNRAGATSAALILLLHHPLDSCPLGTEQLLLAEDGKRRG